MHTQVDTLFNAIWQNYIAITPSADAVHQLLASDDETIVNDHVAFRTFDRSKINLDKLAAHFLALGYKAMGDYDFAAKKLTAKHFEHPNPRNPKVFISELRVDELSDTAIAIINKIVDEIDEDAVLANNFLYSGRIGKSVRMNIEYYCLNQNMLLGCRHGDLEQTISRSVLTT